MALDHLGPIVEPFYSGIKPKEVNGVEQRAGMALHLAVGLPKRLVIE